MIKLRKACAIILIFISDFGYSFPIDSIFPESNKLKSKTITSVRASLSASYIIQKNYSTQDVNSILYLSNLDYYYKFSNIKYNQSFHFRSDLGYIKLIDSVWTKYSDNWKINWALNEISSNTVSHAYRIDISSQWLNSWKYIRGDDKKPTRQWRGGIFNPASFTLSYNVLVNFWDYSSLMLGLTSVRINVKPRYIGASEPTSKSFATTAHSWILVNYGLSGQAFIYSKKISENVDWDNTTSFFINGVSKDQATFDFQNRITVKFLKYLQFRIDSHIIYDPYFSYRLEFDQRFLLGLFYERRNNK